MLQVKIPKPLDFEFNEKVEEYFQIWIVNVLLTILTLSVYSIWVKVGAKQYSYGNITLDDSRDESESVFSYLST